MGKNCCTCLSRIEYDDAPVLTMGAYGTPKLLCDNCAALVETITYGRDYDEITEAMNTLTDVITKSNADDRKVVATVTEILENGAKRAQKIKEGTYDFALDEEEEESFDEIPEELLETEEDRELDARDEERQRKFDSVFNWVSFALITAAVIFVLYRLLDTYVF